MSMMNRLLTPFILVLMLTATDATLPATVRENHFVKEFPRSWDPSTSPHCGGEQWCTRVFMGCLLPTPCLLACQDHAAYFVCRVSDL